MLAVINLRVVVQNAASTATKLSGAFKYGYRDSL